MPGPVEIDQQVQDAFHQPPLSHRSDEFIRRFEGVRATLARMTGAKHVAGLSGSGTVGTEAVPSWLEGRGVVLVRGECGARLAGQASGWNLPVNVGEWPWGVPWDLERVATQLDGAQ